MFSFLRRFGTPEVDLAELDALLKDGSVRILDVREDSEFRSGHLPGPSTSRSSGSPSGWASSSATSGMR